MATFTKLTVESDLPPADEAKEFPCGDKTICVANVNGSYSAMDNVCLHRGGPLGQGMIEDGRVVCPYHGWAFDIKTGVALDEPNERARVFEAVVKDGELWVRPPER